MTEPIDASELDSASGNSACRDCGAASVLVHEGLADRHFASPARMPDGAAGAGSQAQGRWAIRRCDRCGMHWLTPRPREDEIAALYGDYYTHDAPEPAGFEAWLKRAVPGAALGYADQVSRVDRQLARALTAIGPLRVLGEIGRAAVMWLPAPAPDEKRLLDVGCGAGLLLARMRSLGWDVAGVEPDPRGARAVGQRLPGASIYADVEQVPAASFDAVTLSHVVEHLVDPLQALRGCIRALKPGGSLVVTTPNPASAACARFGSSWLHWDPPRHLQLFGAASLVALLERAGFGAVRATTSAGSAHFAFYASAEIERTGAIPGLELGPIPLAVRLAGLRFWVAEHARVTRGEDCGEELVAFAVRPEQAGG